MRVRVAIGLMALAAGFAVPWPALAVVGGRDGGPVASSTVVVLNARGGVCTGIVLSRRAILAAAHCADSRVDLRIHWREGGEPDAAEVLDEHPELLGAKGLVLDLVLAEYSLRMEAGDALDSL